MGRSEHQDSKQKASSTGRMRFLHSRWQALLFALLASSFSLTAYWFPIGIGDLVPTPVDGLFPGVAIHATVAANIIQGNHLYRDLDTVLYDIALIAFIPLISIMLMVFMHKLSQMIAASIFFAALLAAVFYYLVDMLNEFFDQMTSIVLAHEGTLDKFIGDAIMALFNAPLNIADHRYMQHEQPWR